MKHFKRMNEILNEVINQLGIEDILLEGKALSYWSEVVGPEIAGNTTAERVKDGKLFIKVKNDVWRNELFFYKTNLIQKINKRIGKSVITDLVLL